MEYIDLHFKERLDVLSECEGKKEACEIVVTEVLEMLRNNLECAYVIKLCELNLKDQDILDTLLKIRHAVGEDNNRVVFDGDFLVEETKYMLTKLGTLDNTKEIEERVRVEDKEIEININKTKKYKTL